jgi:FkbM family methyltransferase
MSSIEIKSIALRIIGPFRPDADFFLPRVSGVIHVGAHFGEERDIYCAEGLDVLWVEANPEMFDRLTRNLVGYPKQRAALGLVTDVAGSEHTFHISDNEGSSSSIFDLANHSNLYPDVHYAGSMTLKSTTLSSLVNQEGLDMTQFDSLVMDTQGSELLVLKGAADLLHHFKFIRSEAADFEAYKDCCRLSDIDDYLSHHKFHRVLTRRIIRKRGVGSYYEAVYSRNRILSFFSCIAQAVRKATRILKHSS